MTVSSKSTGKQGLQLVSIPGFCHPKEGVCPSHLLEEASTLSLAPELATLSFSF